MEDLKFRELLLKMTFCVMACDGDIDPHEIALIRELDSKENLFQLNDLDEKLDQMLEDINKNGLDFLRSFIEVLETYTLTNEQELKFVEIAIKMIEADNVVLYSEIKFFKILHSRLSLTDDEILSNFSHINDIEYYVEEDIKGGNYLEKVSAAYFDSQIIPKFESIAEIEKVISNKEE